MKISAIVTVYNLEQYVEEAILSILNQTRKADEIIVIDDCSTDGSAERIRRMCASVGSIKYILMSENSGVLLATLKGIELATGTILTFLDGDDVWENTKLEKVAAKFEENANCFLVTHGFQFINRSGEFIKGDLLTESNIRKILDDSKNHDEISDKLKNSILCHKGVWLGSAYAIRKSMFDFDKFMTLLSSNPTPRLTYQDHPIAIFMVLENYKDIVSYIDERLFKYRMHGLNSSGNSSNHLSALKTAKKGMATSMFTYSMVNVFSNLREEVSCQKFKLEEFEFLVALYEGKKIKALFKYVQILINYKPVQFIKKESLRLLGIIVLGNSIFFKLKNQLSNYAK